MWELGHDPHDAVLRCDGVWGTCASSSLIVAILRSFPGQLVSGSPRKSRGPFTASVRDQ